MFGDRVGQLRKEIAEIQEKNSRIHSTRNAVLRAAELQRREERLREIMEELKTLIVRNPETPNTPGGISN